MCEDFEDGHLGWEAWFSGSSFTECNGCPDGINDPARIRLTDAPGAARDGQWALDLPAEASAGYQGASLTYRSCDGDKRAGCPLVGYEQLYFRTWVRLAPDHGYVHHFLSLAGTQPAGYWDSDGNAGCRPNGTRHAGTTVDFNTDHELFFYTYYPEMNCDAGGYCSGQYAQDICDGCAGKDMPCENGLECCWGNHFEPDPPVVLPRDEWVCLEMMMKLDTPGAADGEMAFWMNDTLAHRATGMRWRDTSELKLNKAWLQHYIASGDAQQSHRIWFDDMVVSTARIGCSSGDGGTDDGDTGDGDPSDTDSETGTTETTTGTTDSDPNDTGGEGSAGGSPDGDDGSGCGCRNSSPPPAAIWGLVALGLGRRPRKRLTRQPAR